MATISSLVDRVRLELGDQASTFQVTLLGDGEKTRFETGYFPLDGSTLTVTVDGDAVDPEDITVEERTGLVILASAPDDAAEVVFSGTRYRYFGGTDIQTFVNAAVAQHIYHRTDAFGRQMNIQNLPIVEEYPLAILGSIMALMALVTDASFDIDILAPDGVNIPRSERYRQLMDLLATRQQQYKELCAALNIGLYRIEVFNLRRVSRTTGKLVPVYIDQEIDDYSAKQRVYIPTNTLGSDPVPTSTVTLDLTFTQGDLFTQEIIIGEDITGRTPKAQIRIYPESLQAWAEFEIEVTDYETGTLTISLTSTQTRRLPLKTFWDLQTTNDDDETDITTHIRGTVFCQRDVTRDGGVVPETAGGVQPPLLSGDAQEGFHELQTWDGTGQGTY